jgi:hypothetical protein
MTDPNAIARTRKAEADTAGVVYARPCYRCADMMIFIGCTPIQAAWQCPQGHLHLAMLTAERTT